MAAHVVECRNHDPLALPRDLEFPGCLKTVTSLRRLGVVDGGERRPVTRSPRLAPSPPAAAWLVHAVMLCRQAGSIGVRDAASAPELFWADQNTPDPDYPHLELHTEAANRQVWVPN